MGVGVSVLSILYVFVIHVCIWISIRINVGLKY